MNTVVIIFIVLLVVVSGFAAGVIIDALVRNKKEPAEAVPETAEQSGGNPVAETAAVAANEEVPVAPVPTHEDKYQALPDDARGRYDEIAAYAAAVEGVKQNLNKRCEEYAIGSRKIVKLTIKKDVVVCAFTIRNSNFFASTSENKIAVSTASITTKITSEELVHAAKNTIDMVVRSIEEEKELKRRLASERRKNKTAQKDKNGDEKGVAE